MKLRNSLAALLCGTALTFTASSDAGEPAPAAPLEPEVHDHSTSYPDDHAPIGVMGDHTHDAGEIMLSYRYMFMPMEQNYIGSNSRKWRTTTQDCHGKKPHRFLHESHFPLQPLESQLALFLAHLNLQKE